MMRFVILPNLQVPQVGGLQWVVMLGVLLATAPGAAADALPDANRNVESLARWVLGSGTGSLGAMAQVVVPSGFRFAGAEDTRKLMQAYQNPVSGKELGLLGPSDLDWFVVFEFDDVGFVKDDDRNSLNTAKLLQAIRTGTNDANKERTKRGWPTMEIERWEQPPFYDPETHNLTWAIRAKTGDSTIINYNTRVLGRKGVMRVTLVADPEDLEVATREFKNCMKQFEFLAGNRYTEFVNGDKLARYGLSTLVSGGAEGPDDGLLKQPWALPAAILGAAAIVGMTLIHSASARRRKAQLAIQATTEEPNSHAEPGPGGTPLERQESEGAASTGGLKRITRNSPARR